MLFQQKQKLLIWLYLRFFFRFQLEKHIIEMKTENKFIYFLSKKEERSRNQEVCNK
jgi:hypothetical protein